MPAPDLSGPIPLTRWPRRLPFPLGPLPALDSPWRTTLTNVVTPQGLHSGLQLIWHPGLEVTEGRVRYAVDLVLLLEPGDDDAWLAMSITNAGELYWGQVMHRLCAMGARWEALHTLEGYLGADGSIRSCDRVCVRDTSLAHSAAVCNMRPGFKIPIASPIAWTPIAASIRNALRLQANLVIAERMDL